MESDKNNDSRKISNNTKEKEKKRSKKRKLEQIETSQSDYNESMQPVVKKVKLGEQKEQQQAVSKKNIKAGTEDQYQSRASCYIAH